MLLIQPESRGLGRGICFAEVNRAEVKYYLCRLIDKVDASAQAVAQHPHFTQPLRYCARSGRVRLWVRANLGQICIIPSVDVWVEAAIAASALGALRQETVFFLEQSHFGLLCGRANVKAHGCIFVRWGNC